MAFKLDFSPSYRWPVSHTYVERDGSVVDMKFTIEYARLKQSEVEEISGAYQKADRDPDKMTDQRCAERVVSGWDGLLLPDGTPFTYSFENLQKLMDIQGLRSTIVLSWFDSLRTGQAKNLQTQPAPG
jgi:hypothetical protein